MPSPDSGGLRLMIAGSRGITRADIAGFIEKYVPHGVPIGCVITGGARGVDALAEQYADAHGIEKRVFLPDYERYGRKAPLYRNVRMIEQSDFVLVVWDGRSPGSSFVQRWCMEHGVPGHCVVTDGSGREI